MSSKSLKSREDAFEKWKAFKEEVRAAWPIDRAAEEFADVRFRDPPGRKSRMACCPFHDEKNPSFSVMPESGYYQCFSSACNARGDVFTLISETLGIGFKDAVLEAASRAGISPPGGTPRPAASTAKAKPRRISAPRLPQSDDYLPCDMVPVPDGIRNPEENRWFECWHPGARESGNGSEKRFRPTRVHEYRDVDGRHLVSVMRIEKRDGKKFFVPVRLGPIPGNAPHRFRLTAGGEGWVVGSAPGRRKPVYGMQHVNGWLARGGRSLLIVEGEKTADAARRLLAGAPDGEDWLVLSPMNGSNAARQAEWDGLASRVRDSAMEALHVAIWPDADPLIRMRDGTVRNPQDIYAMDNLHAVLAAFRRAGASVEGVGFVRITPPEGVGKKWDLADAEEEGWSGADVLSALRERAVRIEAAPDAPVQGMDPSEDRGPAPFDLSDIDASFEALHGEEAAEQEGGGMPDEIMAMLEQTGTDPGRAEAPHENADPAADDRAADEGAGGAGDVAEEPAEDAGGGGYLPLSPGDLAIRENNPHFRCLGSRDRQFFFLSLHTNQIFSHAASAIKRDVLQNLAPDGQWWLRHFPGVPDRMGNIPIDWQEAAFAVIRESSRAGIWDDRLEAGQGARIDTGKVVFSNGAELWVEGQGIVLAREFEGKFKYVRGQRCDMPDFENPFPARDPEVRALLEIIRNVNYVSSYRALSIIALFGWLAVGPICGILFWRPHIAIEGPRGCGKSWLVESIVGAVLGTLQVRVVGNSTESGMRNALKGHALPLVFDEAEPRTVEDRKRLANVMALARHSSSPGGGMVTQGTAGGGAQRSYAISSTFLISSVTSLLEASADRTRFGRVMLSRGLHAREFRELLDDPARALLTPEFSRRFAARSVTRASDLEEVSEVMVCAFSEYLGLERRLADLYGIFAAGAWLMLEDGVPEGPVQAIRWLREEFGILDDILSTSEDISEDTDHSRAIEHLLSTAVPCHVAASGQRRVTIASLIESALGLDDEADMPRDEAARHLAQNGLRLSHDGKPVDPEETPSAVIIHRNVRVLHENFKDTPWATGYASIMEQVPGARKLSAPIRFRGIGKSRRAIEVPLTAFGLEKCENEKTGAGVVAS